MDNDLISRSAVKAKATYMYGFGENKYVPLKAIDNAPAVDAVEVVRCKDCRWYQIRKWDDGKPEYDCRKTQGLLDVRPEDFCSKGERRRSDG